MQRESQMITDQIQAMLKSLRKQAKVERQVFRIPLPIVEEVEEIDAAPAPVNGSWHVSYDRKGKPIRMFVPAAE